MSTRNPFAGSSLDKRSRKSTEGEGVRIRAPIDPERDLICCSLPTTDLGIAERWRVRFGGDFRFCPELGWFGWDERRWRLLNEETGGLPGALIQSLMIAARSIRNEAALVAASGYPTEHLSKAELAEVEAWADAIVTTDRNLYLAGDDDGSRKRWLEDREPMDKILGKGQLWSQKLAAFARACESGAMPARVLKWVKGFPDIVVPADAFDKEPLAINVLNGTLRIVRRPEKRSSAEIGAGKSEWHMGGWQVRRDPHRREDLITKLAPVKFAPSAKSPIFDAFLERVQPVPAMRRFILQWFGYSLTGDVSEQKFAFFFGQGLNGKGTCVEAVSYIAGDYAGVIGIESLLDTGTKRRGDQATPDLAKLPGVRLLRVSEPQKGMKFNDGLVKQLTGSDPVEARHLNKGFFTFFPGFKLTISGNTRPAIKDVSHGMWRRVQLVPWDVIIPESEVDRKLGDRLRDEASGLLNRILEGLLDWRENGLIIPEEVRAATHAYRDASDELGRFLRDICEVSEDHANVRAPAGELYKFYEAWSETAGGSGWTRRGFRSALEDKGFKSKSSDGVKWLGIQVRPGVILEAVQRGEWKAADPDPPQPGASDFDPFGDDDLAEWD